MYVLIPLVPLGEESGAQRGVRARVVSNSLAAKLDLHQDAILASFGGDGDGTQGLMYTREASTTDYRPV